MKTTARIQLFHCHAYFEQEVPQRIEEARAFRERIAEAFVGTPHVEVRSFIPAPAGPHPRGSFEVRFTREVFANYVSWLMLERPPDIDILVHPVTRSHVLDHTVRALWLGTPRPLDRAVLEAAQARA
jgi:DOPA 4,5-dioxygenase